VILVDADRFDEDDVTLAAAEGGAEDVEVDGSSFSVTSEPESLSAVRQALEDAGIEIDSSELTMVPRTTVELDDESAAKKTLRLIDALEESDDVQEVYSNFDIPEQVMEAVAT
jgi:transcriptional/translational regulatory protein YebC/TACO1